MPVLQIRQLRKSYPMGFLHLRSRVALEALDLSVNAGEIFGYLGPNGSGKTTTLNIVLGLLRADSGSIEILGGPAQDGAWRPHVGFLPENPYFYDYLTPNEYLDYTGRLFGLTARERHARSEQMLDRVGLLDARRIPMRQFSKGMMQRLGLAQALLNDPELLFLDEPMSGLDPIGRRLVRDLILDQKRRGKTVFFSTHILSDAESLCDRVGLLRSGRLVRAGGLDELLDQQGGGMEIIVGAAPQMDWPRVVPTAKVSRLVDRWRLEMPRIEPLSPVVSRIENAGGRVISIQPLRESLEDVFVREVAQNGSS